MLRCFCCDTLLASYIVEQWRKSRDLEEKLQFPQLGRKLPAHIRKWHNIRK